MEGLLQRNHSLCLLALSPNLRPRNQSYVYRTFCVAGLEPPFKQVASCVKAKTDTCQLFHVACDLRPVILSKLGKGQRQTSELLLAILTQLRQLDSDAVD